jgi:predicted permease
VISDFRFAFRQLAKNPGFATVAALTLALGIGVNTTMFSVLNALVLRASPAREPARLVSIFRTAPQSQAWPQAPANFYDFQRQNISFESVAGYAWNNVNLAEPGQPAERLPAMAVTGNFFTLFGIAPALGRAIGPEDDQPGVGQVAVLSDRFWRGHFAGDPGVIGRSVRMDGQMITVVGVMRPEFEDPLYFGHIDVWKPLALDGGARQNRDNNWIQAIGRLKPGVTLAQAQAEASALADRLARDYPQTNAQNSLRLEPWNTTRVGSLNRSISWLCMGLAGFVLLIACANLANLQLARVAQRIREHAVRVALGATRAQVMRQLLVENIVMSAIGGAIGVLVALWGTKVIGSRILITGISGYDMPIDTRVLAFTVLASVATGIAVGMVPAWIASRTDVSAALKKGSPGRRGRPIEAPFPEGADRLRARPCPHPALGGGLLRARHAAHRRCGHGLAPGRPDHRQHVPALQRELPDGRPVPGVLRQAGLQACAAPRGYGCGHFGNAPGARLLAQRHVPG